jgi:hypothetical protein
VKRNIILFGEMYAGKTTIASWLIGWVGYDQIVRNADRLKRLAADVHNDGVLLEKGGFYEVIDPDTGNPKFLSGREILQRLGSAVKTYDRSFWLRWFNADVAGRSSLVCDDGRYPFELSNAKEQGWLAVRVETPFEERMARAYKDIGRHPAEEQLAHDSETSVESIPPTAFDLVVPGYCDTGETVERIVDRL